MALKDDNDSILAAEYAFGVLDRERIFEMEERISRGDAISNDVTFWQDRLAMTLLAAGTAKPPKNVLTRVEKSLFGQIEQKSGSLDAFPWKKFVVGLIVVKILLLSTWYILQ